MTGNAIARWKAIFLSLMLAVCLAAPAAQLRAADDKKEAEAEPVADPLGRDNPRAMLSSLIAALEQPGVDQLVQYLDLDDPKSEAAQNKAHVFKRMLDEHGTFLKRLSVSADPAGKLDDGLPEEQELIGEIALNEKPVPVLATLVEPEEGKKFWLVSRETLAQLPAELAKPVAEEVKAAEETEEPKLSLFGAPLRSWAIIFSVAVAIYLAVILAVRLLRKATKLFAPEKAEKPARRLLKAFAHPAALYFVYLAVSRLAGPLGAGVVERTALERMSSFVGWVALVWFAWGLVGVADDFAVRRARATDHYERIGLVNFLSRMIRLALIAFTVAACLATFGVNVTAGLAALGVGGLALALGARKTVENFVGSIMVLMDKPVRIGDACDIGGVSGDVEDIGLLSTRIRTRERSILTIPNSKFSGSNIENQTLRDRHYIEQNLPLPLTLGGQGVTKVLEIVRAAFDAEPSRHKTKCPVRFKGIVDGNFQVQIHGYLNADSNADFYLKQERLLLDILGRLEAEDIALAPPVRLLVSDLPNAGSEKSGKPKVRRAPTRAPAA